MAEEKALWTKWANPAFTKLPRQVQHLARIPAPDGPLQQAAILIEPVDISQPLRAR
jgi:hypothetical protein